MSYKSIIYTVSRILLVEAALLTFPAVVAIIYGENTLPSFAVTIGLLVIVGLIGSKLKPQKLSIYAKEGYFIVAFAWILISLFGTLPFYLSGSIPRFIDAFFETVSGFTATGATILRRIEGLPMSILFWRNFTHWIGGMGILVFVIAIMPKTESSSMHIMRAEVPGPTVGKLVSKLRASARILYGIYCVMSLIQVAMLCAGGMPIFDSIVTTFSTAGTGGFSVLNESIKGYNSLYTEMVVAVFMILFGINFNLFYLIAAKQFKQALKSEELRTYLGIIAVATVIIALSLLISNKYDLGNSFRYAFFQVVAIITTTGFTTANYDTWPVITKLILGILMITGACAGSTGGGIKVSRIMILIKGGIRDLRRAINPRSVETVKIDKRTVDESVVRSVSMYFATFMVITAVSTLIVALDGRDLVTTFMAAYACLSNVGPGFGAVGPVGSYTDFSVLSKLVLCFNMLAGRLELLPMLMIFSPYAWSRKY